MNLVISRFMSDPKETIGNLWVDKTPLCFTLEDAHHDVKIMDKTRIPAGTYEIKLRNAGGMNEDYKETFGAMHKGMLWLQDVPDFEWIYIHCGNNDKDTSGCILVGERADLREDLKNIGNSRRAYRNLYPIVASAISKGEKVTITVLDEIARI